MTNPERYIKACHAMQSGVAMMMQFDSSTEPKHLRVGINSSMVDSASLAQLLISKGVFTAEEHMQALADGMEREVSRYEQLLEEKLGSKIHLG